MSCNYGRWPSTAAAAAAAVAAVAVAVAAAVAGRWCSVPVQAVREPVDWNLWSSFRYWVEPRLRTD